MGVTPCARARAHTALDQVATLLFYFVTGFYFRPVGDNPYLKVSSDETEAAVRPQTIAPPLQNTKARGGSVAAARRRPLRLPRAHQRDSFSAR